MCAYFIYRQLCTCLQSAQRSCYIKSNAGDGLVGLYIVEDRQPWDALSSFDHQCADSLPWGSFWHILQWSLSLGGRSIFVGNNDPDTDKHRQDPRSHVELHRSSNYRLSWIPTDKSKLLTEDWCQQHLDRQFRLDFQWGYLSTCWSSQGYCAYIYSESLRYIILT